MSDSPNASNDPCASSDAVVVREWSALAFHRRVIGLEAQGYISRLETYRIIPEVHPETGEVIHLHTMEMILPVNATPSLAHS